MQEDEVCFLADLSSFRPDWPWCWQVFRRSRPKSLHLTPVAVFFEPGWWVWLQYLLQYHRGGTMVYAVYAVRFHGESHKSQSHWQIWCKTFGSCAWILWHHPVMMSAQKGKDSSVGESPPTLRWPYFKESGCWSNHYSWPRRYCSAWCHCFFLGQIGAITMDVLVSKLSNAACFERTGLMGIR